MIRPHFLLFLTIIPLSFVHGQDTGVRVRVLSSETRSPIAGALVSLHARTTATPVFRVFSDSTGAASIGSVPLGLYRLEIHHIGHHPHEDRIICGEHAMDLGIIMLRARAIVISEVVISAEPEIQQKGDTTEYVADAFRTSADASVEDLLHQLPGISFSGGTLRRGLDDVSEILLDGLPIPTSDPLTLLRDIPATAIDRVQVYDRMSEQAEFSGFEDENSRTTVNLVTHKAPITVGTIGAGYGEGGRYEARAFYSRIAGGKRFNAGADARSGSASGSQVMTGTGSGSGATGSPLEDSHMGDQSGRRSLLRMVYGGFRDGWTRGSWSVDYRLTNPESENEIERERWYPGPPETAPVYRERRTETSAQAAHSFGGRIENSFSDALSMVFAPRFILRTGESDRALMGQRDLDVAPSTSRIATANHTSSSSLKGNGTLLLRHRFDLPGRTLSLELRYGKQRDDRTNRNESRTITSGAEGMKGDSLIQRVTDERPSELYESRLVFTEPLTLSSRVQLETIVAGSRSSSTMLTSDLAGVAVPDPAASGSYEHRNGTLRTGGAFQTSIGRILLTLGLGVERTTLSGSAGNARSHSTGRTYTSLLPSAWLKWNDDHASFRIRYTADADLPMLGQLQEVVDNAHPLFQEMGNPSLDRARRHTVRASFSSTPQADIWILLNASGELTADPISRTITVFGADTLLPNGARFLKGGELSSYRNLDRAWSGRGSAEVSVPVGSLASRISVGVSSTASSTPWERNGMAERTRGWGIGPEIMVRTRIDTTLVFRHWYRVSWRSAFTSDAAGGSSRSLQHSFWSEWEWTPRPWVSLKSSIRFVDEAEIVRGFDVSGTLWDVSVRFQPGGGRRFGIWLEAHDILNSDRGGGRRITDTYVEDLRYELLPRYFLLRVQYHWN